MVVVHLFVASKVARYRAFSSAVSLGNTLLCWFNFRYVEFRDSIGTNKAQKDAIVNKILGSIMMALLVVMFLCIVTAINVLKTRT